MESKARYEVGTLFVVDNGEKGRNRYWLVLHKPTGLRVDGCKTLRLARVLADLAWKRLGHVLAMERPTQPSEADYGSWKRTANELVAIEAGIYRNGEALDLDAAMKEALSA